MKYALTYSSSICDVVEADEDAPSEAVCPVCGESVTLRQRSGRSHTTWFWRHQEDGGACAARASLPGEPRLCDAVILEIAQEQVNVA